MTDEEIKMIADRAGFNPALFDIKEANLLKQRLIEFALLVEAYVLQKKE